MAEQYGAVCSNTVAVTNFEAFKTLIESVSWGGTYALEVWKVEEDDWCYREPVRNATMVRFGSEAQYPSAIPEAKEEDNWEPDEVEYGFSAELIEPIPGVDPEPFNLETWVGKLRKLLLPGEILHVVAGGNEKLRYVSFNEFMVSADHEHYVTYYSSSDSVDKQLFESRLKSQ